MKRSGICKLTGTNGTFVTSHLLPKALTRQSIPGAPFIEGGEGRPPKRKWSSWYDRSLVTAEGEAILASLDDWGIRTLRQHRLVWSGWGPITQLTEGNEIPRKAGWRLRELEGLDFEKLRIFLHSLLWRAAASELKEFSSIQLSRDDLETLRLSIIGSSRVPPSLYPATLIQLSTLGPHHNQTPIDAKKLVPEGLDLPAVEVPFFRFYMDGLVIHFNSPPATAKDGSALIVGASSRLAVLTVPFEDSHQKDSLEAIMVDAWEAAVKFGRTGLLFR